MVSFWVVLYGFMLCFTAAVFHGGLEMRRRRKPDDPRVLATTHFSILRLELASFVVVAVLLAVRIVRAFPLNTALIWVYFTDFLIVSAGVYWLYPAASVVCEWDFDPKAPSKATIVFFWLTRVLRYFNAVLATLLVLVVWAVLLLVNY